MAQPMEIKESKVLKFKTLVRLEFWSKNLQTFFIINSKPPELCSKYFLYQISQIFVDLFVKKHDGLVG